MGMSTLGRWAATGEEGGILHERGLGRGWGEHHTRKKGFHWVQVAGLVD